MTPQRIKDAAQSVMAQELQKKLEAQDANVEILLDNQKRFIADIEILNDEIKELEKERDELNNRAQGLAAALESLLAWHTDNNLLPVDSLVNRIQKAKEELAKWEGEGEEPQGLVYEGLQFRSKMSPLEYYEVVKVYNQSKEFNVKVTRNCQVSGTTHYEVWSIGGFEKYLGMGVYYLTNQQKSK